MKEKEPFVVPNRKQKGRPIFAWIEDALCPAQRRERSTAGRDASVMCPGTPLRNSGTTSKSRRMKARSSVVSTTKSLKKARKPQTTNEPSTQAIDSATQAPSEKNEKRAATRVSKKLVAVDRQRSFSP